MAETASVVFLSREMAADEGKVQDQRYLRFTSYELRLYVRCSNDDLFSTTIQDPGYEIWYTGYGIWDMGSGIRDTGFDDNEIMKILSYPHTLIPLTPTSLMLRPSTLSPRSFFLRQFPDHSFEDRQMNGHQEVPVQAAGKPLGPESGGLG